MLAVAVFFAGTGFSEGHGSYHAVVSKLERTLARNPDDAATRFLLAKAHAEHEEWKLCLDELDRIEALAPGEFETGWLRGVSFRQGGMNERAKEELDRFLKDHAEHPEALYERARVAHASGDARSAAADSVRSLSLAPGASAERWIFAADRLEDDERPDEAVRLLDDGLKRHDEDPLLLRRALSLDIALGRWDSGLVRIEKLGKVAPKPEPSMAERAELLSRAGRKEASLDAWRALLDHLGRLPALDRGTPLNRELSTRARAALGLPNPLPVTAPPAPSPNSP